MTVTRRTPTPSNQINHLIERATRNPAIAKKLTALFQTSDATGLDYLQPYDLADTWGTARQETLEAFIRGSRDGLFTLHWQSHCPYCGHTADQHTKIVDLPSENQCSVCHGDYANYLDETVEVSFSVTPKYRPARVIYPAGVSSNKQPGHENQRQSPHPNTVRVTGKDCLLLPLFQKVFKDQTLSEHQSLNIRHMTILFTDIIGSTAIYNEFGDVPAFKAVRNHFRLLRRAVENHHGVIVKTIGDAVMAVFNDDFDAVNSAFAALKLFPYNHPEQIFQLDIKLGIHTGSTIAVNLNEQIDYFGTTVNVAARVQALASGGELVLSEPVFTRLKAHLDAAGYGRYVQKERVLVKGLPRELEIYRIDVQSLRSNPENLRFHFEPNDSTE